MKLLICDDDISTVDVIQSQLDCAELGLSRILRAYNGEAAIRLISKEQPEVIICDIGMPKVSGIDVLKFVHDHRIETEFCFLTCYEDFEYAKAAIRYGASNYLTKPFDMTELRMEIQRMIASAKQKKEAAASAGQAQHDSVLNNVLRQIGDGICGTNPASIDTVLTRNGLALSAQSRWYLTVTCADVTDAMRSVWSRELLMYTVSRLHDETLANYVGSAYSMIDYDGRFLQCCCFVPASTCTESELMERCGMLLSLCSEHISLRPSILVSGEFPLYRAAAVRSELLSRVSRIRLRAGKIFTMDTVDGQAVEHVPFLDANRILQYLKQFDKQGYLEYVGSVIRRIASSGEYTREVLDDFRRELTNVFLTCFRDNGISGKSIFEDSLLSGLNGASVLSSENMLRFADRLFVMTEEPLRSLIDADDIIVKADAYIREHFRENINREDVAAVACITPNYLSKQFHNKMGMNLREYINKIRIDEAKRLLLTTNLSVSEVAGMSGYDNISYFSTVFRKHTGVSPVDWRTAKEGNSNENEAADPCGSAAAENS